MSAYDYQVSREIADRDEPFYALLMAAMRRADTKNLEKLQSVFPRVWEELQDRYDAPGGILESDTDRMIGRPTYG